MNPGFIAVSSFIISTMTSLSFADNSALRPRIVAYYGDDTSQIPPKELETDIRVVLVSDTHNVLIDASRFPAGDLLIHAGDHTEDGKPEELERAAQWLNSVASRYKHGCVTIGGNHDKPLDADSCTNCEAKRLFTGDKMRVLNHETLEVAGLTIFGSPYVPLTPRRQQMAASNPLRQQGFNRDETTLAALYEQIPSNIDVLITHTPPSTVLDTSLFYASRRRQTAVAVGSKALRDWWSQRDVLSRPALHVFGHEHDSRGFINNQELGALFCNAASVDGDRGAGGYVLKPAFRAMVVDFRLHPNCSFEMPAS